MHALMIASSIRKNMKEHNFILYVMLLDENLNMKKFPANVLRHFPLKLRLQRLFTCAQTGESMIWHDKERPKDGKLRHLVVGHAWKDFDLYTPILHVIRATLDWGLLAIGSIYFEQ